MSGDTGPVRGTPIADSPKRGTRVWATVALVAQAGVLFLTLVMGLVSPGIVWVLALTQAAASIGLLVWLAPRPHGAMALAVPVVSLGATVGLFAMSNTVAVACNDRVVAAFEELPPPDGASFTMFVGGETQDCMAEIHGPVDNSEVFAHYRKEFQRHGWRITREYTGFLWAERDGMYINLYDPEGRIYFILEETDEL